MTNMNDKHPFLKQSIAEIKMQQLEKKLIIVSPGRNVYKNAAAS